MRGVEALCHLIVHSSSLFHLNLSANKFSEADVERLGEALNHNHSICGLHFDKNPHGYVDSKGYIHEVGDHGEEHIVGDEKDHHAARKAHALTSSHLNEGYNGSSCWCCGQWVEVEFEFKQLYVDEKDPEDVYLRLR